MLILNLNIGKERYAIQASKVIEIIPLVELDKVPLSDPGIKGLLNYRGIPTPVIDLCQLFEHRQCENTLSTRIIIIEYTDSSSKEKPIGLAAELVTDVTQCQPEEITDSGISNNNTNYLGKVYHHNNDIIQIIDTTKVIPDFISQQLNLADPA